MEDDKKTDKPKASSAKAREYLKNLIDPLADLADAGDAQVQNLLLDFGSIGKMLLETSPVVPGEPCPSCGVVHGEEDTEETDPPSGERIIN